MSKSARDHARILIQRFAEADIPITSAALAYHTLLGIVPLLALTLAYLRKIGITRAWRGQVKEYILGQFNIGTGEDLIRTLERLSQTVSSKSAGYAIFFILAYTVFNLTRRCGDGMDRVLKIEPTAMSFRRAFVVLTLRRALIIFVLPLFLLFSIGLSAWLKQDSWLRFAFKLDTVGPYLARPIPWLIDAAAIFLLFYFVPKKTMSLRLALKSALVSGALFEFSKYLMSNYSKNLLSVQKIYGALATIPLFIIWIQFCWMVILCGPLFFDHRPARTGPKAL